MSTTTGYQIIDGVKVWGDAHAGSIEILHLLRPLGVVMAGADVYDPYKD